MEELKLETACEMNLSIIATQKDGPGREKLVEQTTDLIASKISYGDQVEYWNRGLTCLIGMIVGYVATDEVIIRAQKNNLEFIIKILEQLNKDNSAPAQMFSCKYSREYADVFFTMTDRTQKKIMEDAVKRLHDVLEQEKA